MSKCRKIIDITSLHCALGLRNYYKFHQCYTLITHTTNASLVLRLVLYSRIPPVLPHLGSPCIPLLRPSTIIKDMIWLCAIVISIRSPGRFSRHMIIQPMPYNPIVQNTTSQNKLYMGFVRVERFVVKNSEPILQSPKSPLYCHSER